MHEITYNLDDLDKIINKPKIEIQGLNENTIILLVLVCLLFSLLMLNFKCFTQKLVCSILFSVNNQ